MAVTLTEEEIGGNHFPGRPRKTWVDNVRQLTVGVLSAAHGVAIDSL